MASDEVTQVTVSNGNRDSPNSGSIEQSEGRRRKSIPPPLNLTVDFAGELTNRLTEFAIIATSPQSPLMQKNLPIRKRAYSFPSDEPSPISSHSQSSCLEDSSDEVADDAFISSSELTPEDTKAIFVLSSMAKHKSHMATPLSPPLSPIKQNKDSIRSKRPMNGFMLFAKKFRLEYTHLYPGKDNRAISVLLGDTWKKMKAEERNVYGQEARRLAEEQKKLYPDCWKRKRTLSNS